MRLNLIGLIIIPLFHTNILFSQYMLEIIPDTNKIDSKKYFLSDNKNIIYQLKYPYSGEVRNGNLKTITDSALVIDSISIKISDIYMIGFTTPGKIIGSILKTLIGIILVPAIYVSGYAIFSILWLHTLFSIPSFLLQSEFLIVITGLALGIAAWGGFGLCCLSFHYSMSKVLSNSLAFRYRFYLDNCKTQTLHIIQ